MVWSLAVYAQPTAFPFDIPEYEFIRYDSNRILFPGDSLAWSAFMGSFISMVQAGNEQISIVHIGGSHLQADIYSNRIRQRMQSFQPGSNGGRGLIFPYSLARTNNPSNYKISSRGRWSSCKNTQKNRYCGLGLTGMSVTSAGTDGSVWFGVAEDYPYDFNRLRLLFLDDSASFSPSLETSSPVAEVLRDRKGSITWTLENYVKSARITLERTSGSQKRFTLFGISLETDDPGVIYHSIGVNGAKVPSFLRCTLLEEHLRLLNPDLVILSLGTNDAYTRYFNAERYRENYDSLISRIQSSVPWAAILLTVPNDSYLYRRYTNRNTSVMRDMITGLAREHNAGVWDFYSVMGGLNSILVWQRFGLAKRDRIHFTRKGYLLKGDLFFNAFLKSYDDYIDNLSRPDE